MSNVTNWTAIRNEITCAIVDSVKDPSDWMIAVRGLAEALRLNVARCLPIGGATLDAVVFAVLDEAQKQGRKEAEVRAAVESTI
jgi:hypothetical protein